MPELKVGTKVRTLTSKSSDWTESATMARRWGVRGTVAAHITTGGHGAYYRVRHEDGTEGAYNFNELERD